MRARLCRRRDTVWFGWGRSPTNASLPPTEHRTHQQRRARILWRFTKKNGTTLLGIKEDWSNLDSVASSNGWQDTNHSCIALLRVFAEGLMGVSIALSHLVDRGGRLGERGPLGT